MANAIEARTQNHPMDLSVSDPNSELARALEKSQNAFAKKRTYDRIGYRALVQLHESLMSEGKKTDAYLVLRRLIKTQPIHPQRLSSVLRLAIETGNFNDIESYYEHFLNADTKSDELIRHMYAAQVMSAKAFLREGSLDRSMELFKKAVLTSGRRASVLREAALALARQGHYREADFFISAFPEQERQTTEFRTLDYFVMSKSQPLHLVLQRGRELLRDGIQDPLIYELLIEACKRAGHHDEAESLALDAQRLWPDARTLTPTLVLS
jgi:tetratricopeptide (TPR) repeat protein